MGATKTEKKNHVKSRTHPQKLTIARKPLLLIVQQKQSFFNCLLDMAAMEKTNSRAGSINIDNDGGGGGSGGGNNVNSQTHLLHGQNGSNEERSSLSQLARHSTIRKRSLR